MCMCEQRERERENLRTENNTVVQYNVNLSGTFVLLMATLVVFQFLQRQQLQFCAINRSEEQSTQTEQNSVVRANCWIMVGKLEPNLQMVNVYVRELIAAATVFMFKLAVFFIVPDRHGTYYDCLLIYEILYRYYVSLNSNTTCSKYIQMSRVS